MRPYNHVYSELAVTSVLHRRYQSVGNVSAGLHHFIHRSTARKRGFSVEVQQLRTSSDADLIVVHK